VNGCPSGDGLRGCKRVVRRIMAALEDSYSVCAAEGRMTEWLGGLCRCLRGWRRRGGLIVAIDVARGCR
jgi:hypothetical protein